MSTNLLSITSELRRTVRSLLRHPAFTAAAVLTLALGIGATTAIFSVVYGVLIKPLPYPDADRLVSVRHTASGLGADLYGISGSMFVTYSEENSVFEHFGTWGEGGYALTGGDQPEQIRGVSISDGTLQALGMQPVLGRWFTADEYARGDGPDSVILSYGLWQRRFGADPSVLGRTLSLDSEPAQIVGVMPRGFRFLDLTPDVIRAARRDSSQPLVVGRLNGGPGIARLKPGVTLAAANADLARLLPIWLDAWPEARPGFREQVLNWRIAPAVMPLRDEVVGGVAGMLWVLMGTVGAVLLVACANIANLLLARADARRHELVIRAALGAGRKRIAGELFRESFVLGAIGGAVGFALAYAGLQLLAAFAPPNLPRVEDIGVGPAVLAFAVAASLVSSLLFGAIPAVKHALRSDSLLGVATRGASASRERNRTRSALIVVQVAFALVLLVGSGLMIRTFLALTAVDPGFRQPETVQLARIWIPPALIVDAERWTPLYREILERIAALPGVSAAGYGGGVPGGGGTLGGPVTGPAISVEDRPDLGQALPVSTGGVSPGYFEALGTRFVAGRDLAWADVDQRRPVTLVSENLARELWGEPLAALGKRIRWNASGPWLEIVGVTQDIYYSLYRPAPRSMHEPIVPVRGDGLRTTTYVIRSDRAGTESLANEIRHAVWAGNPDLTVYEVRTLQQHYSDSLARTSFMLVLLAIAGVMALFLSVVGIYGVISYIVSQRTREIGIRLALGAQPRSVKGMFVRQGLVVAMVGVAIGLAAAVALSRWLTSFLFEVRPLDIPTYGVVLGVLLIAVTLAAYMPARRAARLDPVETLRAE
jgi:putative ABC transport system permease protein